MTTGERIRELRGAETQMELAHRAGINERTLRRLEKDLHTGSVQTLLAISKALGVTLDELLGEAA